MPSSGPEDARSGGLLSFALAVALVVAYAFAVPVAAHRDGDFVHLWVAGRLPAAALYDIASQKATLDAQGLGHIWMARNDSLGLFFYPPAAALPYALLALLPLHAAASLCAVINIGVAAACAWLMADLLQRSNSLQRSMILGPAACLALILSAPATFFAYALGQNGSWTLLILLGGGALLIRGRAVAGGAVLGLLVAKPSWLLAICWLPLVLGGARVWLGMALGGGALGLVSLAIYGPGPWMDWLALAPRVAALDRLPGYMLNTQFNLVGLVRRLFGLGPLATALGGALAVGAVGLCVAAARRIADPVPRYAMALCVASLCNPHLHHYDLLPPLLALGWLLSRLGPAASVGLLVAHHLAFIVGAPLALPTLAVLGLAINTRGLARSAKTGQP